VVKTGHFTPGKDPTTTVKEAEWALKQVWSAQKISQPLGFDPQIIQPVGSGYTDDITLATWLQIHLPTCKIKICS